MTVLFFIRSIFNHLNFGFLQHRENFQFSVVPVCLAFNQTEFDVFSSDRLVFNARFFPLFVEGLDHEQTQQHNNDSLHITIIITIAC